MTERDLAAEAYAYLEQHGQASAHQVAKAIRACAIDVLDAIKTDERFCGPYRREDDPTDQRLYYRLADRETQPGTARNGNTSSRAGLMAEALADGEWHDRHDLFNQAGRFYLTNNAASELRDRGLDVEHKVEDGAHLYRLVAA